MHPNQFKLNGNSTSIANSQMVAKLFLMMASILLFVSTPARAGDLESAKQQLEKVKVDLENSTWDSFNDDVKSTEMFLDGLPAADRDPVQKQLNDLKAKGAAGYKDYKSKSILETAKRNLDSAAESLQTAPGSVKDTLDQTIELLSGDDAKQYADADQVAKMKSRATSLKAMADTKLLDFAAPIIKELDDTMATQPFKDAKSPEDVDHVSQSLDMLKKRVLGAIDKVPASDPRVVAINAKLAGYDKTIAAATGNAGATQAADDLAQQWKAQQEYFAGWDQEGPGPSWDDYTHHQSDLMSSLNMPKTIDLLTRVRTWLQEDSAKNASAQSAGNPAIKATLDDANKEFTTAAAKVHAAVSKLLTDAEALPVPKDELFRGKAGYLADNADRWLQGTTFHDADVARAKKLNDKWTSAVEGAAAAKQATLEKMTKDAAAKWPGISSGIKAEDDFTPDKLSQFKGKTIHLTGNNRCGWDYEPGSYRFAKKINGMVVAGKYDANVAASVDAAVKATGQDLPDEDWDLYATVEGPGKISERSTDTGKIKVDGQEVGTVTAERHDSVDCAVVKIFALHAGPVAVGPNGSSVSDVVRTASTTTTSHSVLRWLTHLFELMICIGAGGLVALKARPVLAAQVSGGTTAVKMPGSENTAMAGLGFIVLGLLWLVAKLIIGDLLPATCVTLCGVCLASDWMVGRQMLPSSLAVKFKALALPIAGATILFGVLHLFLADQYLF